MLAPGPIQNAFGGWALMLAVIFLNIGMPICDASDIFLVTDRGTALLDGSGEVVERLNSAGSSHSAFSPDRNWVAYYESKKPEPGVERVGHVVIRSMNQPDELTTVRKIWNASGTTFGVVWAPDSKRILITESGPVDQVWKTVRRIYDRTTGIVKEIELPENWSPGGWSLDGTQFLLNLDGRLAWGSVDGTGEPEFITSKFDYVFTCELSPDGKRILCTATLRRDYKNGRSLRLNVIDLETKRRSIIDDPGVVDGACWSPDGSRIAYTWQHNPEDVKNVDERETFLITCNIEGEQRKTVTSRKIQLKPNDNRDTISYFFTLRGWR